MAAVRQANENASVVMILPDWPDRPWYRLAHKHFARVFTFKTGVCLFERQHKGPGPARWYCAPSQWPVTVYAKLSGASEKSLSALLERELGAFQMQHTGLIDEHYGLDCTTGLHTQHDKTFTDTGNVKLALGNQQDDALHTDATARMHAMHMHEHNGAPEPVPASLHGCPRLSYLEGGHYGADTRHPPPEILQAQQGFANKQTEHNGANAVTQTATGLVAAGTAHLIGEHNGAAPDDPQAGNGQLSSINLQPSSPDEEGPSLTFQASTMSSQPSPSPADTDELELYEDASENFEDAADRHHVPGNIETLQDTQATVYSIPTSAAQQCMLLLHCTIAGLPACALLDTGASRCFIDQRFAEANKLHYTTVPGISVILADGSKCRSSRAIQTTLKAGTSSTKQTFTVLPLARYDAIIGMDYLSKLHANIDVEKRQIVLRSRKRTHLIPAHCCCAAEQGACASCKKSTACRNIAMAAKKAPKPADNAPVIAAAATQAPLSRADSTEYEVHNANAQ